MRAPLQRPETLCRTSDEWASLFVRPRWAVPLQTLIPCILYAALSVAGFLLHSAFAWPVIWGALALLLYGFLSAAHDCAHGSVFKTRRANFLAGVLWTAPLFINFALYRHHHLEHHRVFIAPVEAPRLPVFEHAYHYARNLWGTPYAYLFLFVKIAWEAHRNRFPHSIVRDRARREVWAANRILMGWAFIIAAATLAWPRAALFLYWLPLAFCYPVIFFFSLPEHVGCSDTVATVHNSRSVRSNALLRFFLWNANFHAAHHMCPGVPSWNLGKLDGFLGERLHFRERSYFEYHAVMLMRLGPPTVTKLRHKLLRTV